MEANPTQNPPVTQIPETPNQTPPPESSTPPVEPEAQDTPVVVPAKSYLEIHIDDAKSTKHKSMLALEISVVITVMVLLLNFLMIYMTNKQTEQYQTTLAQIAATAYNTSDREYTVAFLESQKQNTQLIKRALPVEVEFIEFIQTLELISQESATQSQLEFNPYVPVTTGQSYVPFVISMTTDLINFTEFLKKTEKLPYILEIRSIEASLVDANAQIWNYKLFSKVYVSNQFR